MSVQAGDDRSVDPSLKQDHASFVDEILQRKSLYLSLRRSCEIFILALVTLPALLVVTVAAIAIYFSMGAPVLFLEDRIGLRGRKFRMVKLRTMMQKPSDQIGATSAHD